MNWISEKAGWLLKIGVEKIYLPRDKFGQMDKMLNGTKKFTQIKDEENPLFVASQNYLIKQNYKKSIDSAFNNYTIANKRFICICN